MRVLKLVTNSFVCVDHPNFPVCVCVCVNSLAWLSSSGGHAKAAVILQPEAEAEEHRYFIMASFITPGTAWHRSQSPSSSSSSSSPPPPSNLIPRPSLLTAALVPRSASPLPRSPLCVCNSSAVTLSLCCPPASLRSFPPLSLYLPFSALHSIPSFPFLLINSSVILCVPLSWPILPGFH